MQTETKPGTYSLRVAACRYAAAAQGGDEKRAGEALADLERAAAAHAKAGAR